MNDVISRRDLLRITRGFTRFPDVASGHIFTAQQQNANEAKRYMLALVPEKEGETKLNTGAIAYKNNGVIGFAMSTARDNAPGSNATDKTERIRAILFANNTDFFYGVWNLNKKTWRGRMRKAMRKTSKQIAGGLQ